MLNYPTYHQLDTQSDIQMACFDQDQNLKSLQNQIDELSREINTLNWELQHVMNTYNVIDPSEIAEIYVGRDGKIEKLWPLDCDKLAWKAAQQNEATE